MPSVFSRIIAGEIPSHRILENDEFLAFLDIRPVRPGHTLVVPKQEIDYFFDLDDALLSRVLLFAKPITRAIRQVTGAERIGAVVAGFDVPHAHLHLIPADTMADLDFSRATAASAEELSQMAAKIREALGSL
ncbi:MAG: HIT family protein [Firmicutes bacterium]|nr:HIT family protein [Bacillota bacterium]